MQQLRQSTFLLRYPIKSSGFRLPSILSTAATRLPRFIRHRRRSVRSPPDIGIDFVRLFPYPAPKKEPPSGRPLPMWIRESITAALWAAYCVPAVQPAGSRSPLGCGIQFVRLFSYPAPKKEPPSGRPFLEQDTGVEPAFTAWEAVVLPIYESCVCRGIIAKPHRNFNHFLSEAVLQL